MWRSVFLVAAVIVAAGVPPAAAAPDGGSGRCRDGRVWTTSVADQAQMLTRLNQVRASESRPALRRAPVLDRMALAHAADMACRNYFDHINPERDSLPDRFKRANDGSVEGWRRLAEVIGTSTAPERQVERWLGSRAHRRAVLEARHDAVGIGLVHIAGSRYDTYWVVDLIEERR